MLRADVQQHRTPTRRVLVHEGAAVERTRLRFSSYHIELLIAAIAEVAESVGGQWYGGYGWTGRASELGARAQKRQRQAARAQAITEIRPERRGAWPRRTVQRQRPTSNGNGNVQLDLCSLFTIEI